jgi:DNA-binding NarL/FixJ family response regulator
LIPVYTEDSVMVIGDDVGLRVASTLKPRDLSMLALLVQGKQNKDIAEILAIGIDAVKKRFKAIFDVTGMSTRLELAVFVIDHPALHVAAVGALITTRQIKSCSALALV